MVNPREPLFCAAAGEKGVGKTYNTINFVIEPYIKGNPALGIKPKKVLILDVNNEYQQYRPLGSDEKSIISFMKQPIVEARRIGVFKSDGSVKTTSELQDDLEKVLKLFKGGLLVIEDIARIAGDAMSMELYGSLCTNRHRNCDVYTHYQSVAKIGHPKIKATINILRLHHVKDSIPRHKNKFEEYYEIISIANNIVDKRFKDGDIRFFVYINFDKNKIIGKFNDEEIDEAIIKYISENESDTIRPLLNRRDLKSGKKMYSYGTAVIMKNQELEDAYFE